jgi:hypothetical protein
VRVHLAGSIARRFADMSPGTVFCFAEQGRNYIAIKAENSGRQGAVVISPTYPAERVPVFLQRQFDDLLLAMPKVHLIPSTEDDDMTIGSAINYNDLLPGTIFLSGNEKKFLSFTAFDNSGRLSLVHYLDIESGLVVVDHNSFRSPAPIVIGRWALIAQLWSKPKIIFTFPDISKPLDLGCSPAASRDGSP